ncbi:hypothetical protein SAMN03159390_01198 [Pseudomonas sp. NFACC49-2]|nr:hypothetical protein SAMN03159390_01198 [Pseudomonas sp. NFACC49-2]SFX39757.1 hypothetical protein SAMN03159352_01123 [Pseudomonas sp. NFACC43]SIS10025.1 hypothetical protein SAMN05428955_1689 [Pseudomonas sp. 7SR1]
MCLDVNNSYNDNNCDDRSQLRKCCSWVAMFLLRRLDPVARQGAAPGHGPP